MVVSAFVTEEEGARLAQNPSCDVCAAMVSASAPHSFNGFDLLCEKCFCRKFDGCKLQWVLFFERELLTQTLVLLSAQSINVTSFVVENERIDAPAGIASRHRFIHVSLSDVKSRCAGLR